MYGCVCTVLICLFVGLTVSLIVWDLLVTVALVCLFVFLKQAPKMEFRLALSLPRSPDWLQSCYVDQSGLQFAV